MLTRFDWSYLGIGRVLGAVVAVPVFLGSWIYAVSEYGFLVGVTLGWIPAAILAALSAAGVTFLWGPAVALALFLWLNSPGQVAQVTPIGEEYAAELEEDFTTDGTDAALAADAAAAEAAEWESNTEAYSAPVYHYPGPYESSRGSLDCTVDCSGHEAGYAWAEENGLTNSYDCDGSSDSFIEGCEAYVEDNF